MTRPTPDGTLMFVMKYTISAMNRGRLGYKNSRKKLEMANFNHSSSSNWMSRVVGK